MGSMAVQSATVDTSKPDTFLPPIEKPKGIMMKLAYYFTRRQFGKVLTPLKVHSARLPMAFGQFYAKIGRLDKKLQLPPEPVMLIRGQVFGCAASPPVSPLTLLRGRHPAVPGSPGGPASSKPASGPGQFLIGPCAAPGADEIPGSLRDGSGPSTPGKPFPFLRGKFPT